MSMLKGIAFTKGSLGPVVVVMGWFGVVVVGGGQADGTEGGLWIFSFDRYITFKGKTSMQSNVSARSGNGLGRQGGH